VRNFTVEGHKGQDGKIRLKIMEKQASKWIYCCLSAIQDSMEKQASKWIYCCLSAIQDS